MFFKIDYSGTCYTGHRRSSNEDNFWCDGHYLPEVHNGTDGIISGSLIASGAFAVFDGVGGEACGEAASHLAAMTFDGEYKKYKRKFFLKNPLKWLDHVYTDMNDAVCRETETRRVQHMGSTACIVLFENNKVVYSNIGDSRIFRTEQDTLLQISKDHVMKSAFYPKPLLTQCLGVDPSDFKIEPSISTAPINKGDKYLICTDGVTDIILPEELYEILNRNKPLPDRAADIKNLVMDRGEPDNATFFIMELK